jgi:inner membrane protein
MLLFAFQRFLRSPGFKFFLILTLALLLTIPMMLVWALVEERSMRAQSVISEIGAQWGEPQTIVGPFLTVPYTMRVITMQGDKQVQELRTERAVFLPEDLAIDAKSSSKILERSIFKAAVYNGVAQLSGRFAAPDMAAVAPDAVAVRWPDATFSLGISDVSGLKIASDITLAGPLGGVLAGQSKLPFEPSIGVTSSGMTGIHARIGKLATNAVPSGATTLPALDFSMSLDFTGSQSLTFAPVARETRISLTSDWPHPSFSGAFLPTDRAVTADGFSASWKVPHLARSVPQVWTTSEQNFTVGELNAYLFGVNLYTPIDIYDLATRSLKYGLMFVAAGFMAVFLMEVAARRPVHPVQYLFVGLSLIFFFVLLLSLAEHIGFALAYIIAAGVNAAMLGIYVGRSLKSSLRGLVMTGILLILFGLLYLMLVLEDYALLAGAVAGFTMLTAAMFLTLRIDWSGSTIAPDAGAPDRGAAPALA